MKSLLMQTAWQDMILIIPLVFMLLGSIFLSFKTRFIQIRTIPLMIKLFLSSIMKKQTSAGTPHTIRAHRALFTAMMSAFGIGNIVAPIIAIGFGGPGALLGFVVATLFGTATTFCEVSLALAYRKKNPDGSISGGPMQYLKQGVHPLLALTYALSCCIMLITWSGKQANTLAGLMQTYHVPSYLTGLILVVLITFILLRGIKLIGNLASKMVPVMGILYSASMLYILFSHAEKIPAAITLVFQSAFTPHALAGAGIGVGLQQALRWGLSEAAFANEAGIGTATIPHSMASTDNAMEQGIMAMITVYTSGFFCTLSGLVILVTGWYKAPQSEFGITMLSNILYQHFSNFGPVILLGIVVLFAFGATLANSYNGSQCFLYVTKNRWITLYYGLIALALFAATILDVKTLWSMASYFIVPVAVSNIIGIVTIAVKRPELLSISKDLQ